MRECRVNVLPMDTAGYNIAPFAVGFVEPFIMHNYFLVVRPTSTLTSDSALNRRERSSRRPECSDWRHLTIDRDLCTISDEPRNSNGTWTPARMVRGMSATFGE